MATLEMIWPEDRLATPPEYSPPDDYRLRTFRPGDEKAYIELMRAAGFDCWTDETLDEVLKNAIPEGVIFAEHEASSAIAATAMGWYKPNDLFPDAYEMGWVAASPEHQGRGLGRVVTAASTDTIIRAGASSIYLLTDDWRLPAIKGYLRVGYVPFFSKPDIKPCWQEVFSKLALSMDAYATVDHAAQTERKA